MGWALMARRYDVVVWGATGFTGQLVCEHLVKHYQVKSVTTIKYFQTRNGALIGAGRVSCA